MKTACYPPGPKRKLPGSIFLAIRRDPLGFLNQLARDYGDIVHFKVGPQRIFLLNQPDAIKDVVVIVIALLPLFVAQSIARIQRGRQALVVLWASWRRVDSLASRTKQLPAFAAELLRVEPS